MIWQNPWAWVGLATLGIPVLVHLLGRDRAPRHGFPTLRFLEVVDLLPTRRTRVHDALLLALRIGILGVAVAALAQPLLMSPERTRAFDQRLARAIIVDTSVSMQRTTLGGERAVDVARREAGRLAGEARTSVLLESAAPSRAIAGALAWLATQPSRRELVIASDFQRRTLDSSDVAAIPAAVGFRPMFIEARAAEFPIERRASGGGNLSTRIDLIAERTSVSWTSERARDSSASSDGLPVLVADSSERIDAGAAANAGGTIPVWLPVDTNIAIAVVYPGVDARALARSAKPLRSRALIDIASRIRADSLLASSAVTESAARETDSAIVRNGLTIATTDGRAAAVAMQDSVGRRERLLLFSFVDARSIASAALIAAARRAVSVAPPIAEAEPLAISKTVVDGWARPPSTEPQRDAIVSSNGPSDGRWLWLAALLLLGVEAWARRTVPVRTPNVVERVNDRAA